MLPQTDKQVADLRETLAVLREENRQLRELLRHDSVDVPLEWGLTRTQRIVFRLLVSREWVTPEAFAAAAYSHRSDGGPDSVKNLRGQIHKIRRKTARYGVHIKSIYGVGFRLRDRHRFQTDLQPTADLSARK